jgi:hypothetical protein
MTTRQRQELEQYLRQLLGKHYREGYHETRTPESRSSAAEPIKPRKSYRRGQGERE